MAVDWDSPTETSDYTDILDEIRARDANLLTMQFSGDSNIPLGAVRRNSSDSDKFEKYNGSTWSTLSWISTVFSHIADTTVHSQLSSGDIKLAAYATPATGWLLCNGDAVSRTTYSALFTKIGTTFGSGDGSTTFNLPDFQLRIPIGVGGSVSLGTQTGSFDHDHSTSDHVHAQTTHTHDMGNHTHTGGAHTHSTPSHTHSVPAHYHYAQANGGDIAISGGSHNHAIAGWASTGGGSPRRVIRATGATDDAFSTTTETHTHPSTEFSGRVGNTSGVNGDSAMTSGSSSGTTGSGGTVATGAPSTNTTGASAAVDTGAAGAGTTGTANPPVLGIYFHIKT